MPGPANYSLLKDFEKNDSPAYTFGHRALAKTRELHLSVRPTVCISFTY